ncbi:MAG: GIY-YIG nuclease family protein [bacterium]|nr:GIY-YIG nuclease family protein [bacterium]
MYILKSIKDKDFYIGFTSDLKKRLKEHNSGSVRSTKSRKPFKLVNYEAYQSKEEAKLRENNLKLRARAFRQLLKRINLSIDY